MTNIVSAMIHDFASADAITSALAKSGHPVVLDIPYEVWGKIRDAFMWQPSGGNIKDFRYSAPYDERYYAACIFNGCKINILRPHPNRT